MSSGSSSTAAVPQKSSSYTALPSLTNVPAPKAHRRVPSPIHLPTPFMPLIDNPSPHTSNLVKPSIFYNNPLSSQRVIPPLSPSMPIPPLPSPPLHSPGTLHRQHGSPMLQPFPSQTPPSLAPIHSSMQNCGSTLSRDQIREALLILVQDNDFIDMVRRALHNVHRS
ncbi:hypothetical protein LIER_13581 [Lithospermum erythrorhizon]|uniref:mRNA-decapping enzyme-like protein n=1 Tax=Lithospermum erythrorhizon TaxID=34254 RepID=A0AAV3PVY4_LITER